MSARAFPAAEAALRFEVPQALWLDALCVPLDEPARSSCLSRMGVIYSRASRVVVVLSEGSAPVLEQIASSRKVDVDRLPLLEQDPWVSRVWTYQEMVNSQDVRFVAEGGGDSVVQAMDLLNHVGTAIHEYRKSLPGGSFELRARHPRLDSLESLIVDWRIAEYTERSAYQVLSAMHGRDAAAPEDVFYAMLGAVSAASVDVGAFAGQTAAERFMQLCEAKGDFSFIYTTAPRADVPGRRWRPQSVARFDAVFPWLCDGPGQPGQLHSTHLELREMYRAPLGTITSDAATFIDRWLGANAPQPPAERAKVVFDQLRSAGFGACGQCIELEDGYFFPHSETDLAEGEFVAVSTGVRMPHGAPGLLLRQRDQPLHELVAVGLFVGKAGERREMIHIS
jgi:hypothetical protein